MITEADVQAPDTGTGTDPGTAVTAKAPATQEDSMVVAAPEEEPIELRPCLDRPVYKLSVKLIDTYKNINRVCRAQFFCVLAYNRHVIHRIRSCW